MREVRDALLDKEEALEASQQEVEALKEEIRTKQSVMDKKIKLAEEQIELMAEKDKKIEMLKQRVDSVNKEFNRQWGGGKRQDPQKATTLEDVYKLTGESYSKDWWLSKLR